MPRSERQAASSHTQPERLPAKLPAQKYLRAMAVALSAQASQRQAENAAQAPRTLHLIYLDWPARCSTVCSSFDRCTAGQPACRPSPHPPASSRACDVAEILMFPLMLLLRSGAEDHRARASSRAAAPLPGCSASHSAPSALALRPGPIPPAPPSTRMPFCFLPRRGAPAISLHLHSW